MNTMCAFCGSGIPMCAANGVCATAVQQVVGISTIFGAGFIAIVKDRLSVYVDIIMRIL
jgi:hypothetical protein